MRLFDVRAFCIVVSFASIGFEAFAYILWATPSAAGPRLLLIASGLQILGIVASGSWYFWDANLSLGMIGGFILASWGTLGRFWETGEHNKGNFKVQA